MRIYRVERDGETFYIPPSKLADYHAEGYSLYAEGSLDSASGSGESGGLSAQSRRSRSAQSSEEGEFEIEASSLQEIMAAGIADLVHTS